MDGGTGFPSADQLNAMSEREYKVLENRLRRAAQRQGLKLEKSRLRDPRAIGFGTYQPVDAATNMLVTQGLQSGYGLGLDEVARTLFFDR